MAGDISRENGKKGGRPEGTRSEAYLRSLAARDYISKQLEDNLAPIVNKAIHDAIQGDDKARQWLSDRGWGKAIQPVTATDEDGNPTPFNIINYGQLSGGAVQVQSPIVPAADSRSTAEVQGSGTA